MGSRFKRCIISPQRRQRHLAAFTLVELLVVITIIAILMLLLLPAIQAAREAARRTLCTNNMHQIGIAVFNFETTLNTFPSGSTHDMGAGWAASILPFIEGQSIHERLDLNGDFYTVAQNRYPIYNVGVLADYAEPTYICPSSSLPSLIIPDDIRSAQGDTQIVAGHYVGIMGASHDGNIPEPDLDPTGQGRVCDFSPPGPPSCNFGGYAASNGMFYPHSAVVTKHITDGTSKTLMIAEQSDWGFRPPGVCGSGTVDIRSSRRTGIWVGFHWWVEEQIQNCDPNNPQEGGTSTTVRWPINTKTRLSWDDGIAKYGFNEPIQSAHPSGALGVYADGSVHFMEEDIDMEVLRWLCIRDDGMMH